MCKQPEKAISEINKKFDISIPNNYAEKMRNMTFHVRAGNKLKRNINNFRGFSYDEKWKADLSNFQKLTAGVILSPFHKMWMRNE
ncbi:hypothetical protein GF396_01215 [Candidatus Pacearchaeota archaeon]|nr:hypothetical protein [Candidatus Pacearchaeota archaeon]